MAASDYRYYPILLVHLSGRPQMSLLLITAHAMERRQLILGCSFHVSPVRDRIARLRYP